jgi:hypothetical protein
MGPFAISITLVLVVGFGGPCGGRRDPGSASSWALRSEMIYHIVGETGDERHSPEGIELDEHGGEQASASGWCMCRQLPVLPGL